MYDILSVYLENGLRVWIKQGSKHESYKQNGLYYKLKTMSALKNKSCLECIQLPICISTCKLKRYRNNDKCTGKWADGLEIKDRALLQYYSDLSENIIKEEDIV